jgi:redox-sensitive bicupin YhaK (pirin superfamily)
MGATLKAGERVTLDLAEGRHAYLVPAIGRLTIDGEAIAARDGVALTGGSAFEIVAVEDAEIVLVDAE